MLFRVPYHVLPTFPSSDQLTVLWKLSRDIRSGNLSTICISGSNVIKKIFDLIGDIDFCEYFPTSDLHGFDRMTANIDGTTDIACVSLSVGGQNWHSPWTKGKPNRESLVGNLDCLTTETSFGKFNYIGHIDNLGVTEISNLIIALDRNGESAGLAKTFAAQEAPLVAIEHLPNQMCDPFEMGRYINWLANTITILSKDGKYIKCIKRCASLSRLMFLPEITNSILELVSDNPILIEEKKKKLKFILKNLHKMNDQRSTTLSEKAESQLRFISEKLTNHDSDSHAHHEHFAQQTIKIIRRLSQLTRLEFNMDRVIT
jgi:hypothetical protein